MTPIREQIILITGSTDGLGKATAREFAARGAIVLIHGRSAERIEATLGEIATATGKPKGQGYCADLADLRQVRRLAREVVGGQTRLDLLINNAGIGAGNMDKPRRETSVDGYELRFAVNSVALPPHSRARAVARGRGSVAHRKRRFGGAGSARFLKKRLLLRGESADGMIVNVN